MSFANFSPPTDALGKQASWAYSSNISLRSCRVARPEGLKSATRSDRANCFPKCATLEEHTCRAFHRIFRNFLVNRVGMHYVMRFYAFQKGKLHAFNARQRRRAKLEGARDSVATNHESSDSSVRQLLQFSYLWINGQVVGKLDSMLHWVCASNVNVNAGCVHDEVNTKSESGVTKAMWHAVPLQMNIIYCLPVSADSRRCMILNTAAGPGVAGSSASWIVSCTCKLGRTAEDRRPSVLPLEG